jgi:hypothetical protein
MAALYLLTSRLWASIGYHIAWNFTEGYVFGAQVSGTESDPSLYQVRPAAGVDTLWSGGAFGPEASVANVVMDCCWRRTACTREASRLISCGGTNTSANATPSISDDWDEAHPERAGAEQPHDQKQTIGLY